MHLKLCEWRRSPPGHLGEKVHLDVQYQRYCHVTFLVQPIFD
jgi:hypothetical protein